MLITWKYWFTELRRSYKYQSIPSYDFGKSHSLRPPLFSSGKFLGYLEVHSAGVTPLDGTDLCCIALGQSWATVNGLKMANRELEQDPLPPNWVLIKSTRKPSLRGLEHTEAIWEVYGTHRKAALRNASHKEVSHQWNCGKTAVLMLHGS